MPTATDLVTDLPADFEVFGQAVATSMADLLGGTSGQILAKNSNTDMDFVWVTNDVGDITAVNVTSPITGGGSSGAVTVGIQSASTSQSGAVQLSDSTSTTSSVLASTPTATKSAYDLAASAYAPAFTNNFYAGKNKIINGAFNVWQRGTSITPSAGVSTYTADRFFVVMPAGSTISRQPFTAGTAPVAGYEGQYYMNTVITANAQNYEAGQKIENARTFAGQTVTFSFWARSTVGAQTMNVLLQQNFGTGGSPSATTDGTLISSSTGNAQYTPTGTWTRYYFTYSLASVAGKTFGTNDNSFLLVRPFQYTATTTNTSLDIWGVQVEAGSTVTPFQTATGTIQGELAACQRYFYFQTNGSGGKAVGMAAMITTTQVRTVVPFPVTMRTTPTAVVTSGSNYYGVVLNGTSYYTNSLSINAPGPSAAELYGTISAVTVGWAGVIEAADASASISFSAEL